MNKVNNVTSTGRGTVSLILFFSFVLLPVSGIAVHLGEERGSDALRHAMTAVHVIAGLVFTVASVIHMKHNWKALTRHAVKNTGKAFTAVLVLAVLMFLAFFH